VFAVPHDLTMLPIWFMTVALLFVFLWLLPLIYHFEWYVSNGGPADIPPEFITRFGGSELLTSEQFVRFRGQNAFFDEDFRRQLRLIISVYEQLRLSPIAP
jgi:hypothetical protein